MSESDVHQHRWPDAHDTSSYGARTIDGLVRCVGIDRLVYGSHQPVVAASPPLICWMDVA